MRLIQLTKGLSTEVDDEDFDWLSEYKWFAGTHNPYSFVACRKEKAFPSGYLTLYMHRVIMKTPSHLVVDHIDHNSLNNQKSNLRNCSQQQNLWNGHKKFGASQYKGVSWDIHRNKWSARIRYKGKRLYLGRFSTEIDAAVAYDNAAKKLYGEFASLNFN